MELVIQLAGVEKTELIIRRNWFTGRFVYIENGESNLLKSPLNPSAHFSLRLKKVYEFVVGNKEKHRVKVEHIRPLLLAGFRPQKFNVYINDELKKQYHGY